jgi:methanethiol S-methyltransferase
MTASGDAQRTPRRYHQQHRIVTGVSAADRAPNACGVARAVPRAAGVAAPTEEDVMFGRVAALIYGLASYLVFFLSFIYAVAFIGNYLVPKSIDVGSAGTGLASSILIDVLLLGLFAIQHSVMARPAFKRWWTGIIPASCERSTYVLISSLLLFLIFWQWRPIATTIWRVDGWPATLLTAIAWIGWLTALMSTWMIDHFELFGLRQVFDALRSAAARVQPFTTPLLYRLVRHPLMLGFLLAFWATPHMTVGHLLFAVLTTGYIFVGVRLEERDLVAHFGDSYERYRQRVPMLMPRLPGGRSRLAVEPGAESR